MTELLKNAMKATLEHNKNTMRLPEVVVTIFFNEMDMYIRISDQGGGVPRDVGEKIWSYSYTTTSSEPVESEATDALVLDTNRLQQNGGPLSGFGVGLPMSRAYAEYFGGSLNSTFVGVSKQLV